MRSELKESLIFFSVVMAGAILWYQYWVKPNTEKMHSIMDCMTEVGDHTKDGYVYCAKQLGYER